MASSSRAGISRRDLLVRAVPACAGACMGVCTPTGLAAVCRELEGQQRHKFDVQHERTMSERQSVASQYGAFMGLVKTMRPKLGDEALIAHLNAYSAAVGESVGRAQAAQAPDTSFQTFVRAFRPPAYATTLTHEVVEDTPKAFGLRVSECVWAAVFRDAGLGGDIGHAAVCNMDYYWPQAFNPHFKMERSKTLMQGDEYCNHRYIDTE